MAKPRRSQEEFQALIIENWGADHFDFSLTHYEGRRKLVTVICKKDPTHGAVTLEAGNLIQRGCPKCGRIRQRGWVEKPTREFLQSKIDERFGAGKLELLPLENYKNQDSEVELRCLADPGHGTYRLQFHTVVRTHLGCRRCLDALTRDTSAFEAAPASGIEEVQLLVSAAPAPEQEPAPAPPTKAPLSAALKIRAPKLTKRPATKPAAKLPKTPQELKAQRDLRNKKQRNWRRKRAGKPLDDSPAQPAKREMDRAELMARIEVHQGAGALDIESTESIFVRDTRVSAHCLRDPGHGSWQVKVNNLVDGYGCPKCGKDRSDAYKRSLALNAAQTLQQRLDEAHGHGAVAINPANYVNARTPIEARCLLDPSHAPWVGPPHALIRGGGCPTCSTTVSRGERLIGQLLAERGLTFETQRRFIGRRRYDFFIPSLSLLIEYDGKQHFEPVKYFSSKHQCEVTAWREASERDAQKMHWAKEHGLLLERISYLEKVQTRLEEILDGAPVRSRAGRLKPEDAAMVESVLSSATLADALAANPEIAASTAWYIRAGVWQLEAAKVKGDRELSTNARKVDQPKQLCSPQELQKILEVRKPPQIIEARKHPRKRSGRPRQTFEINDKKYTSISALARGFNIPFSRVHDRLTRGWSVEQACELAPPPERNRRSKKVKEKGLRVTPDLKGVALQTYRARLRRGQSPQEAMRPAKQVSPVHIKGREYPSLTAARKAHGLTRTQFNIRRRNGETVEEAFGSIRRPEKPLFPCTYQGIEYASEADLAMVAAVSQPTLHSRLMLGWELDKAMTTPPDRSKRNGITVAGIAFSSVREAANHFKVDKAVAESRVRGCGWSWEEAFEVAHRAHPTRNTYVVTSPADEVFKVMSLSAFAEYFGLPRRGKGLAEVASNNRLTGSNQRWRGWRSRIADANDDHLPLWTPPAQDFPLAA